MRKFQSKSLLYTTVNLLCYASTIFSFSCVNSLVPALYIGLEPYTCNYLDIRPSALFFAAPKRGSIVDSYRTVKITCGKCKTHLFSYKKKNGTKSKLVKMYLERIVKDPLNLLDIVVSDQKEDSNYHCPTCKAEFGKNDFIKGLPCIKIIGNRVQMK